MDNEQRCETCKWLDCHADGYGRCEFIVILPNSISEHEFNHRIMHMSDGKDCPTWHAK